MGEDDQCVYTIETTCGAPGFSIDSTSSVGNDDFAIFYLDFLAGDAGIQNDGTATVSLADGTTVIDAGDQAGHLPNDPHAFTWVPSPGDGGPGTTSGFVVPGRFAGKWFKSYKDELDAFTAATAKYHGPYCPELLYPDTVAYRAGYTDCDADGVVIPA